MSFDQNQETQTSPIAGTLDEELEQAQPPPPSKGLGGIALAALLLAVALIGGVIGGLVVATDRGRVPALPPASEVEAPALPEAPPGSIAAIVEAIRPSVVAVETAGVGLEELLEPVPSGAGTGVIIDASGHILTNAHVVQDAERIEVVVSDDQRLEAEVVGRDSLTDIAVLRVPAEGLSPAPIGDSERLRVGDRVIAVGNALALEGGPTVTEGIVSALNRAIQTRNSILENLIQTDAAINPGNSGGPLLNLAGEVVGINTAIAGGAQNIGFAIAISPVRSIVDELIQNGRVSRPFLGVQMADVTPAVARREGLSVEEGALIVLVVSGSAAEQGGLRPGDVVVEVDGDRMTDVREVVEAINRRRPGDQLRLVVVRGEERLSLQARLGERPE